jgi:molecular chaperone DnaK
MSVEHVGIDLGTTTSGLAYIRSDGNPEIVPNADGERLTPSVVYFDKHEKVKLVGSAARDGGDPNRTVHFIKRHMDDPEYFYQVDGETWTPAEISALILAKLKRDCSTIVGEIENVVVTVPANFNELARTATINAGKIAGLKVTRLVNEPTAAALYYAHAKGVTGNILVYDLGGGTLDITVLHVAKDGTVQIITSEGARHLGGSNFDEVILDMFAGAYLDAYGAHLFSDDSQRLHALHSSEDAKRMLSKLKKVTETIGNDRQGIARVELTRDMFEDSVGRLLTRTVMLVEQALVSANLKPDDIDHVVLVGGSTRIPRVKEILREHFGQDPISCGNVDEVVALGAALFAKNGNQVAEVCNHSYGTIAVIEDASTGEAKVQNSIVIPKNTAIPCSMSQTYITSEDNEKVIEVDITQGEDSDPRYVDVIAQITLDVPPGRPAGCEVTVTYGYDESQRINARVTDVETGKSKDVAITYHGAGVLSPKQVERKSAYLKQVRIE